MKKNSGQILIYVLFIIIIFTAVTLMVTNLMTRELEIREIGEKSIKTQYAAEAGWERAKYYIKTHNPLSSSVTINKDTSANDKNPLDNGYTYSVTITLPGGIRQDGSTCNAQLNNYSIDSLGESPQ